MTLSVTQPQIRFVGDRLSVEFGAADFASPVAYDLFKRAKRLPEYEILLDASGLAAGITAPARFASMLGVDRPPVDVDRLPWPAHFTAEFDDQPAIVQMALDAKRFACWSDCGLGKTCIGFEWARQVSHRSLAAGGSGRVLIVTLNEIVPQWIEEAAKFYGDSLPVVRIDSRDAMRRWCASGIAVEVTDSEGEKLDASIPLPSIAVVNYEKFNHKTEAEQVIHELRSLAGIVLDESSRLKTGGGKQKWALIKSARGIEYKLSLTATPAPNELMEFASQASFLERMRSESIADAAQQIIWTYFTRCPKTHRWTIKQHARAAFFEWMASWSIYVRDPRKFGWRKTWSPPPEPEYFRHEITLTDEQRQLVMDFNNDPKNVAEANLGSMFAGELNAIAAVKLSQAAKGFIYEKPVDGKRQAERTDDDELPGFYAGGSDVDSERDECDRDGGEGGAGEHGAAEGRGLQTAGSRKSGASAASRRARSIRSLKPAAVADLIVSEMYAGHQVLVWTIFDEETAILQRLLLDHPKLNGRHSRGGRAYRTIRDIDTLTGSTSDADRVQTLADYRAGKCRCLISRASMLGYGMNLQFVGSMIFSGWDFSYEAFYQAIRRAYRHGQQKRLRVHLPVIPELEGQMYDAIVRKQRQHEEAIAEMEANYIRARSGLITPAMPAEGERAA